MTKITLHLVNKELGNRDVKISPKTSYGQVAEEILASYGIAEHPKILFLQQKWEIRNLARDVPSRIPNCNSTLDEQFNFSNLLSVNKEITVHFKDVPIICTLTVHSKYGHRKIPRSLTFTPADTLADVIEVIRKEFAIIDGAEINLIHQGDLCNLGDYSIKLEDFVPKFDPRHIMVIVVEVVKDRGVFDQSVIVF